MTSDYAAIAREYGDDIAWAVQRMEYLKPGMKVRRPDGREYTVVHAGAGQIVKVSEFGGLAFHFDSIEPVGGWPERSGAAGA